MCALVKGFFDLSDILCGRVSANTYGTPRPAGRTQWQWDGEPHGCLKEGSPAGDGEIQRRISLSAQDSIADEHQIRIDAEILEPTITESHTARIRITTTNEGSKRALPVASDGCELFNRAKRGSDEPPGLWLHNPASVENIDRD